jgi:hypothetical protein
MAQLIIGVDPHQRSATIEIINEREQAVGAGRFATDRDGYQAMLAAGRKHLWCAKIHPRVGTRMPHPAASGSFARWDVPITIRKGHIGIMSRSLRCLLGMHTWRKRHNEQGQIYRTCQRCGKDDDPGSRITAAGG